MREKTKERCADHAIQHHTISTVSGATCDMVTCLIRSSDVETFQISETSCLELVPVGTQSG